MECSVPSLIFMESQPPLLRAGESILAKEVNLPLLHTATPDKFPLNFINVFMDFGG